MTDSKNCSEIRWGRFVARKPTAVMISSLLVCFICFGGFAFYSSETATEKLWIPQSAPAIDHKEQYDSFYGSSYGREKITIIAKGSSDSNMLRKDIILEIHRFDAELRNLTTEYVDDKDKSNIIGLSHVCAPICSDCRDKNTGEADCLMLANPLDLWKDSDGKFNFDDVTEDSATACSFSNTKCSIIQRINAGRGIDQTVYNNASWYDAERQYNPRGTWGGIVKDSNGEIVSAGALQYSYLTDKNLQLEEKVEAWQNQFMKFSQDFKSNIIEIYPQSDNAISEEFSKNIRADLTALSIGILGIIIYVIIALGKFDPVKNRSILALNGVFSCILAIGVGYGAASFVGLKSTPVTNVLPFILIGIGVDDMFVLCSALDQAKGKTIEDRIGHAVGHAGLSIFITSATDIFAFALGASSQLPALTYFCGFAAFGVLADFFLQITFFVGAMVRDIERQERGGTDCFGACFCKPTGALCCGGKLAKNEHGILRTFLAAYYTPLLHSNVFRGLVIAAVVALAGTMSYGATMLKQDFSFRFFVNDDSYLTDIFDIEDQYFGDLGLPFYAVTLSAEYHTKAVQLKYEQLIVDIDACTGCDFNGEARSWVEKDTTVAWYTKFKEYVQGCDDSFLCSGSKSLDNDGLVPEDSFYSWLNDFLQSPSGFRFQGDIVFDNDDTPTSIKAARFRSLYVAVGKADEQVKSMLDMREIVDKADITDSSFPYMFMYLYYEQYAIIVGEGIQNLSLALLAVFFITAILLANIGMTLLVMLCVVLVDIDLLGLMYFWDLSIDSVSVVNLVLAIGLAVDYTVHVAHVFITTPGKDRVERSKFAVESMGSSVLHGATSTFVAVMVLSTSQSYIFRSFFKLFFGIVVFGVFHGLVFLPVMMSLIGPAAVSSEVSPSNDKVMDVSAAKDKEISDNDKSFDV